MYYDNLGFLITNYKLGPVYIDSHLNEVMNISAAIEFQKRNPPEKQKAYTLTLYGKEYSFRFPSLTKEEDKEAKDITFELYDKILTLANLGYLNDYVTGLWKEIAANYHVLETEDGKRGLEKRAVLVAKSAYPSLEDQAAILMAKDMVMGRYNSEKLKYYTSKDEYEEVPISRDYEMPDPRDREKTLKFFDNYTVGLRDALLQKALKGWNEDPAHRNFQRNSLLQTWQIEFLKRRQHRTVALCPRRCVHEDSLIKLEDGSYKPAKEVTYDDRLREGKKILRIDKSVQECIKIRLKCGNEMIVSKDHRIPTMRNWNPDKGHFDLNEDRYITYNKLENRRHLLGEVIPVIDPVKDEKELFTVYRSKEFGINITEGDFYGEVFEEYTPPFKLSSIVGVQDDLGKCNVIDFEVAGDHTFIADGIVTHNSGKSMLMALDSLCCLLEYNHKKGVHPKTVLYLSKDVRTFMAVVEYIQELLMGLGWLKNFFHFASKEQVLYFRDPRTKDVYGMIKFLTGEGRSPGVGAFGDYLYVDEAMYIHEEIFRKLEPIVTHEGAGLTVMSTFYQSGEGGDKIYDRPVKLCNLYEKESAKILDIDNHILRQYDNFVNKGVHPEKTVAGLRFTIDDVDVILDKEGIKSSYEQDPDRYLKELYCRASQKDTVFNYKPSVVNTIHDPAKHTYQIGDVNGNLTTVQEYWDLMVIGYDPARTSDMSAVVVTGYSKSRGVISVIREQQLNFADKSSFLPQAEKLLEIYQWAKTKSSQVVLAMDGSHPGVVDVLLSKNVPIFRSYKWCGGEKVTKGKTAFEFNVPKHLMIEATKFLLDNKKVEIWDTVPILLNQLETFVEIKNFYQNKSKYQGKDNHDDFVAAFMVVCRCLYEDFEFKYGLDKGPSLPDNRLKEAVEEARFKREQTIQVRPASESLTFNFWY